MAVANPERERKAAIFRAKSTDSLDAAELARQAGKHRSACNRAYYAVYQMLNAELWGYTAFEAKEMNANYPDNWLHSVLGFMTIQVFCQVPGTTEQRKQWKNQVFSLEKFRKLADYDLNGDPEVTAEISQQGLADARALITLIENKNAAANNTSPANPGAANP